MDPNPQMYSDILSSNRLCLCGRNTEKDGFSNRRCFLPQAIFSLKEPRHFILFLLFQGVAATPTDHLRG